MHKPRTFAWTGLPLQAMQGVVVVSGLMLASVALPAAERFVEDRSVQEFMDEMASAHDFERVELERVFMQAVFLPEVVEAISRPAEAKPWYEYRPIFVTEARIEAGLEFWGQHEKTLERAEQRFGVPASVIVAILGVETRYGAYTGNWRVLDSLSTLAFRYPRRGEFFRRELIEFLLLAREEGFDPTMLNGSYAGAMGLPQFISSSYRRYAVDFDGDRVRDLLGNPADAIGSIGNYLEVHGWRRGESVAVGALVEGERFGDLLERGLKPERSVAEMRAYGISPVTPLPGGQPAVLLGLESRDGTEYWLGLQNFYAITRYNHSALYAMAVYQLAEAIRERYEARRPAG